MTAWRRGADGEVAAARALERRLAATGVVLLHDRRLPRSRANIDHIAVGPGGVTVVDPKAVTGQVRVEARGGLLRPRTQHLLVGGRDRTKLVEGVERQVDAVRSAVPDGVDVRGVLCWLKREELPWLATLRVRDVPIRSVRGVAALAARPGPLTREEVDALARDLARRFPPA